MVRYEELVWCGRILVKRSPNSPTRLECLEPTERRVADRGGHGHDQPPTTTTTNMGFRKARERHEISRSIYVYLPAKCSPSPTMAIRDVSGQMLPEEKKHRGRASMRRSPTSRATQTGGDAVQSPSARDGCKSPAIPAKMKEARCQRARGGRGNNKQAFSVQGRKGLGARGRDQGPGGCRRGHESFEVDGVEDSRSRRLSVAALIRRSRRQHRPPSPLHPRATVAAASTLTHGMAPSSTSGAGRLDSHAACRPAPCPSIPVGPGRIRWGTFPFHA